MRELVAYTDFLAICTARNERQARAIVDEVRLRVKRESGLLPGGVDGGGEAGWTSSTTSTASCTSSPRRPASATSSRTCGARRRGSSSSSTRPRSLRRAPPSACDELPSEGAPYGCRAWEASSGRCSATAAPKWTRRSRLATRRSAHLERQTAAAQRRDDRPSSRRETAALVGHGDRARARDPRPDRAPAGGQRVPRPQHRLARRGHRPARGDAGAGPRPGDPDPDESAARGGRGEPAGAGADRRRARLPVRAAGGRRRQPEPESAPDDDGLFEGQVKLEIGPLGDFSQLVGFEDAVGQLGASEISVERFSEGRATLSMHLDEPVDLLRELEELSDARLQGPPHRPGQPDPRRRRGSGPRAARRLRRPQLSV